MITALIQAFKQNPNLKTAQSVLDYRRRRPLANSFITPAELQHVREVWADGCFQQAEQLPSIWRNAA